MKAPQDFFSSWFGRLGSAVLVSVVLASIAEAQISLTLDDPNQSVPAPASGITTVDFSGTVVVCPGCFMIGATLDNPFNSSHTSGLTGMLDSGFLTFSQGGFGTYTGPLFSIAVPTGTLPDLYGFRVLGGASELHLFGASAGGSIFEPSAPFSVEVTSVPEASTIWLLVLGGVGAVLWRARVRAS
jgi:hypothetical protein